ncbi:hypothetical protein Tco_0770164 [Tanacetum coccineum]|uniref:Uncharacterized protein n=1 Tax=Tanacetum coccineum TaxID=301880 RepID=A0ABQ4ZF38_9ASTR
MDEPEPHPAYDYAGNPNNNNNRWIEADVPLLGELGAVADEPMVGPLDYKIAEPIVEAEEHAIALVIDMDEDISMMFGDDDFGDDDSKGFDEEEVWGGGLFPLPSPGLPVPPSVIEDLSTRFGNLEYRHGKLVKKVIHVSDAKVADGITIGEIGPRISAVKGQVQVIASQMVYAAYRLEQAAVQQIDLQIQQLQTTVCELSSRESTLMQCILGMIRRLADLERRPLGPQ